MFNLTTLKIILALSIGLSILIVGDFKPKAILLAVILTGSALLTVAKPDKIQNSAVQYNQQQTENHGNNSVLCNCICNIQEPVQN